MFTEPESLRQAAKAKTKKNFLSGRSGKENA
jgi:hypothetical protein